MQQKIFSQNPSFTEEQQLTNPLLKKFAKGAKKSQINQKSNTTQPKGFEEVGIGQNNKSSHPLSAHPCFRSAIDRLCGNLVNLLDLPGKLDHKSYFKDSLVKKIPFDGIEMK